MWCVPKLDEEYIARMEDVLDTLAKPMNPDEPVVAIDERPVQLHGSARPDTPMSPGRVKRRDYEYVRRGTANVFCIVEPKGGRHLTHATTNRKGARFAGAMQRIADAYPNAQTIHIIMDNLSTHREKSLTDRWGWVYGRELWSRFTVHYTPKHGSWLNPAEIEASMWSRECMGRNRFPELSVLQNQTKAWNRQTDRSRRTIQWRFTTEKARRLFGYRCKSTTLRGRH
jgi:DDE superfamily endonuclease